MQIIKIGRSSSNDIVINDASVSRIHCQIIRDDNGTFRIIDLNSANGTYINGVRRAEVTLNKSDIVRIGNTTLPWLSYFSSNSGGGRTVVGSTNSYGAAEQQGHNIGISIVSGNSVGSADYPPQQVPPGNKPDSFLVWSILCTLCCCLPFGIVSIVYASKVDGLWASGQYLEAERAAQSARTWFWWGFGLGLASSIFTFIYYCIIGFAGFL